MGTHLRVQSESYLMNTNMTAFNYLRPCSLNEISLSIGRVKYEYTKYLKESCGLGYCQYFYFKYYLKNALVTQIFPKQSRLSGRFRQQFAPDVNGLTHSRHVAAKTTCLFRWYISKKAIFRKHLKESRSSIFFLWAPLLQIFCEIMLHSKVIFKSMTGPDDTHHVNL